MSSTGSIFERAESISEEPCPICYEGDFDLESGKIRLEVPLCRHSFCISCLKEHCFLCISERIVPIPCPDHTCKDLLPDDFIETVMMRDNANAVGLENDGSGGNATIAMNAEECDKAWIKYLRWKTLASDPSLTLCPRCDRLVAPPGRAEGLYNPETGDPEDTPEPGEQQTVRHCTACSHSFCSLHGDSHPGLTCEEYNMTPEMRQSEEVLRKLTKPCSQCGARLQKKSGCNHVVCAACRTHMCWRCGTHVYMDGLHCTFCGSRYGGARLPESQSGRLRACIGDCLLVVLLVLLIIAWVFVGILLFVLTGFCACFFCCGRQINHIYPNLKNSRRLRGVRLAFIWTMLPVAVALDMYNIIEFPELDEMDSGYSVEIPVLPVVRGGVDREE
jgi:hypothetical protein